MTVSELLAKLKDVPPDAQVWIAIDGGRHDCYEGRPLSAGFEASSGRFWLVDWYDNEEDAK